MDTKVKASTSSNVDKELMWGILTANPQVIAHHHGQELKRLSERKNKTQFHRRTDELLNTVMNTVADPMFVIAIVKCWLTHYQLPFEPDKLLSFERFHQEFGTFVIRHNDKIPII